MNMVASHWWFRVDIAVSIQIVRQFAMRGIEEQTKVKYKASRNMSIAAGMTAARILLFFHFFKQAAESLTFPDFLSAFFSSAFRNAAESRSYQSAALLDGRPSVEEADRDFFMVRSIKSPCLFGDIKAMHRKGLPFLGRAKYPHVEKQKKYEISICSFF